MIEFRGVRFLYGNANYRLDQPQSSNHTGRTSGAFCVAMTVDVRSQRWVPVSPIPLVSRDSVLWVPYVCERGMLEASSILFYFVPASWRNRFSPYRFRSVWYQCYQILRSNSASGTCTVVWNGTVVRGYVHGSIGCDWCS